MRIFVLLTVLIIVGCTSYPRYGKYTPVTPRENVPTREVYSTNDYIRLGMIMRKYLGKPYKGKSRYEEGLDCSKFSSSVFGEFSNMELPRTVAAQYKQGVEVPRSRLMFGDLVFFRTDRKKVSHVGILSGHNEFIHASTSHGVIITSMRDIYWSERYVGARRILQRQSDK